MNCSGVWSKDPSEKRGGPRSALTAAVHSTKACGSVPARGPLAPRGDWPTQALLIGAFPLGDSHRQRFFSLQKGPQSRACSVPENVYQVLQAGFTILAEDTKPCDWSLKRFLRASSCEEGTAEDTTQSECWAGSAQGQTAKWFGTKPQLAARRGTCLYFVRGS